MKYILTLKPDFLSTVGIAFAPGSGVGKQMIPAIRRVDVLWDGAMAAIGR